MTHPTHGQPSFYLPSPTLFPTEDSTPSTSSSTSSNQIASIAHQILHDSNPTHTRKRPNELDFSTPLHRAVFDGKVNEVSFFVKKFNANCRDSDHSTPLHLAAENGEFEIVKILIESGAILDAQDLEWMTPLHLAIENNCQEIAIFLINQGASVNIHNLDHGTPLHTATIVGDLVLTQLLLERGAKVNNAINQRGSTPLHLAAEYGHHHIASHLISCGAEIDPNNLESFTPLHVAAHYGQKEVVELLSSQKANINALTRDKKTPCHLALECLKDSLNNDLSMNCLLIVRHFLLMGMDLNLRDYNHRNVTDKISKWNFDFIKNFISILKEPDIERLLSLYDFLYKIDTIDGPSSSFLIPLIPSLYICLASLSHSCRTQMKESLSLLSDHQLQQLFNTQKTFNQNYLEELTHYPPEALCRMAQWMEPEELEAIRQLLQDHLHHLIHPSAITILKERLDQVSKQENCSIEKEIEPFLNELYPLVKILSLWSTKEEYFSSLLTPSQLEHVCQTYVEICSMAKVLTELRVEKLKNQPFLDEEVDIFSHLTSLKLITQNEYEEILGFLPNRLYLYGLFNVKDLMTLGIHNDLELLIDKILDHNETNHEILLWKERNQKTIEMISTQALPSSPGEKRAIDYFLGLLEDVCENPIFERLIQLKKADQARRIICLKAYLTQKNIDKILNNTRWLSENSLSAWAQKNSVETISSFYTMEILSENPVPSTSKSI